MSDPINQNHATPSIIAELNGDVLPLAPGEAPLEHDAPRDAQLTVKVKAAPSKVAAMDAIHSTKAGGDGYRVRVQGEYLAEAPGGKGKVAKPFEIEVNLPSLDGALSVIKNTILARAVKKKYPDAIKPRGAGRIVHAHPLTPSTPQTRNLQYMDHDNLVLYVKQVGAPLDPSDYPDVVDLRDAVIDWTQNPKGFEAREAVKLGERKLHAGVADMNPDLAD